MFLKPYLARFICQLHVFRLCYACTCVYVRIFVLKDRNAISLNMTSKLDLCEGGSFSPTIFKSDIKLSVYHISCLIIICLSVHRFVDGKFAENVHIVLSGPH